jgi:hypothetical protein
MPNLTYSTRNQGVLMYIDVLRRNLQYLMLVFFVLTLLVIITACAPLGVPTTNISAIHTVTSKPATPQECPYGGTEITVDNSVSVACNGDPGLSGAPGVSPSVVSQPATLVQCPTGGVQLTVGNAVSVICNGSQGAVGGIGPVGEPGQDLTPVTIVQFCPNDTPSYPNTFVEYGLCISDQLYAVYSIPGAFLTSLPPGAYLSTAIGSSCDFTVTSGCNITH